MCNRLKKYIPRPIDLSSFKLNFYLQGYGEIQVLHDKYLSQIDLRGYDISCIHLGASQIDINFGGTIAPHRFKGKQYTTFISVDYNGVVVDSTKGITDEEAEHVVDCVATQLVHITKQLVSSKVKSAPSTSSEAGFKPMTKLSYRELLTTYLNQSLDEIKVISLCQYRAKVFSVYWCEEHHGLLAKEYWRGEPLGQLWRLDSFMDTEFILVGQKYDTGMISYMDASSVVSYMSDFGLNSARFILTEQGIDISSVPHTVKVEVFTESDDEKFYVTLLDGNEWDSRPVDLTEFDLGTKKKPRFTLTGYQPSLAVDTGNDFCHSEG